MKHAALAVVFGLACLAVERCGAAAQEPAPVEAPRPPAWAEDPALVLAIVGTNEAGIDGYADHLAIAAYVEREARRRGLSIPDYARARFRRALALPGERRNRPWIAHLSRSLDAPGEWPEDRQHWIERRDQWREALERMDRFVRGEVRAPCSPSTWGSPVYDRDELDAAIENGARRLDCGATRNEFLAFR